MLKNRPRQKDSEIALGEKLRACRKEISMPMRVLADGAGLSVGFISQVERGLTVPSLSSLRAISGVLEMPISYFLEQPRGSESTTRGSKRISYSVEEGSLSYERLSTNFHGSRIRSVIVHEPPGYRTEPISHEGEEIFFMLNGEITVEIEGKRTVLREGDSIHFDSSQIHATWNHTGETVSWLWCGTMDVFGEDMIDPVHRDGKSPKKPKHDKVGEHR